MPVPKRKTSKSRRDKRHANCGINPQAFTACSNCQEPIMPHIACNTCGFYKGRKIFKTKLDRSVAKKELHQQAVMNAQAKSEAEVQSEEPVKK